MHYEIQTASDKHYRCLEMQHLLPHCSAPVKCWFWLGIPSRFSWYGANYHSVRHFGIRHFGIRHSGTFPISQSHTLLSLYLSLHFSPRLSPLIHWTSPQLDQFYCTHPIGTCNNRVWTRSLGKLGPVDIRQSVIIVGVNYIVSH